MAGGYRSQVPAGAWRWWGPGVSSRLARHTAQEETGMSQLIDQMAERQIQAALEQGQLDRLPGQGLV